MSASLAAGPDLIFLGQVTVDDVVPATPGLWRRVLGGSALYGIAGARLWLDPARIGLVARCGRGYPFDLKEILLEAGVRHVALRGVAEEHLIEWVIYEPNGNRRCLPRNEALHGVGAEGFTDPRRYIDKLLEITPTAEDVPEGWLPAAALHLCPQAGSRHPDSLRALAGKIGRISLDPSPRYSRALDPAGLAAFLPGVTSLMPSVEEIGPLVETFGAEAAANALHLAGFPEVIVKRGAAPIVLAAEGQVVTIPTIAATEVDATGAGDSFCGAYAACRLLGHSPAEAARRAAATAALVVACRGAAAALSLQGPVPLP